MRFSKGTFLQTARPTAGNTVGANACLGAGIRAARVSLFVVMLACGYSARAAAPHRYDHVVIVMEENRTPTEIIGDLGNAPYITSLANGGVRLGSMFAITHPSQPNYLHLFSGGNQGVLSDSLPPNFSTTPTAAYPFRAPNLAAEIIAAGFTFAGFSEQIEAAGTNDWADYDPHSATDPGVEYRRKHSPWVNWVAKTFPMPGNQLTSAVNRAFFQFPSNFNELPTVSFVIPNQLHDMHDGSRRQGDDWLHANLDAYAQWARTNNSLLIITWDEDDYNSINQIPTIFYGAGLRDGTIVGGTWTLHNLLRTIEDMYGAAAHAGSAAQVRPIVGPFVEDPRVNTITLQQGLNGYAGAQDTFIAADAPTLNNATAQLLNADLDTSGTAGNQESQMLVRFDSIFGNAAGQVPTNAIILSAKLILFTPLSPSGLDYDSDDTFRAHRMLVDWNDTATWNSLGNGVVADDIEAASAPTFSLVPEVDGAPAIFDVTSDIEMFRDGTTNRGWVIRPSTSGVGNGWTVFSSEATNQLRPALEITYSRGTSPYLEWALAKGLTAANNAPEEDADGDGASNLVEFAYNLNPLVPDVHPMSPTGTNGVPHGRYFAAGSELQIQFVRRKGPNADGLSYTSEFSGSVLGPWASGQIPTVVSLNADWERVIVRDTVSGAASRFGRVIVTLQP